MYMLGNVLDACNQNTYSCTEYILFVYSICVCIFDVHLTQCCIILGGLPLSATHRHPQPAGQWVADGCADKQLRAIGSSTYAK